MIQRAGIRTACFFMFGFPGETEADVDATIRFATRLDPTYASFHVAGPYPGTELCNALGWPPIECAGLWFCHPEADMLAKTVRKGLARFYFRPASLIRRLAVADFRSVMRGVRLLSGYFAPHR